MPTTLVAVESVAQRILLIRGQKVMLDVDLAGLYGVPTKRFNEQVKRNFARFPSDFMFQLTENEHESLRSQNATLKSRRGQHRKYLPYAFTEHGAIMAASVLNSPRAVEMSVFIVRAFVQLREMLSSNKAVAAKLLELERKLSGHDQAIVGLIDAVRQLMAHPSGTSRPIGFTADITQQSEIKTTKTHIRQTYGMSLWLAIHSGIKVAHLCVGARFIGRFECLAIAR